MRCFSVKFIYGSLNLTEPSYQDPERKMFKLFWRRLAIMSCSANNYDNHSMVQLPV